MPDHTGFILAAYAVTGAVFAGLVAAVLRDHRAQRRALASLSTQIERRDARSAGPHASKGSGDDDP